jgi:DNA-binding GntR family transcriptional regulator
MGTGATKKTTKQERVYVALRERILTGTYGPGYRVVIDSIAQEFGVSALPVREAVRRLEAEGLVIFRANAGAQVAPVEPGLFEDEMTVLAVLEGYATALAAPHLTGDDLKRLTDITDQMVAAATTMDPLSFGRLNQDFHALIYDRCPNAPLVDRLRESARRLDAIRRTVFIQIPYRGAESVKEHRALIKLLRRRDEFEAIEAAARAHKLRTVDSFRAWEASRGRTPDSGG